jgi:uncharacterized protein (UPF0332 family)
MSFNWTEYLALAQDLAGQGVTPPTEEAKLRSAISRAYYAAFCKARNHLRDRERCSIPDTGEAHAKVRDIFWGSPLKQRRKIGTGLNRLREDRRKADYVDSVNNLPNITTKALTECNKILVELGRL